MTATMPPAAGRDESSKEDKEIADYVNSVRFALHDLESDEVEEVLEDLEVHLREVRADADDSLVALVGSPEEFAAELRASAGFGPAPGQPERLSKAVAVVEKLKTRALSNRHVLSLWNFLPELRPAWWLVRGIGLAVVLSEVTSSNTDGYLPAPAIFDSRFVGLVITLALMVASVRWGRSQTVDSRRKALWALSGAVAVVGALILGASFGSSTNYVYADEGGSYVDYTILPANIYAYLPDGTPVDGVLLYNETGDPIVLPEAGYSERTGTEFNTNMPLDDRGVAVQNYYPREMFIFDYGQAGPINRPVAPPIVAIPPMTPSVDESLDPALEESQAPDITEAPDVTEAPEATRAPDVTEAPDVMAEPQAPEPEEG